MFFDKQWLDTYTSTTINSEKYLLLLRNDELVPDFDISTERLLGLSYRGS